MSDGRAGGGEEGDAAVRAVRVDARAPLSAAAPQGSFISVIAGFSFLGIMLGVATLIVVMAVMNGFRAELLDKILGINGHIIVQPIDSELTDYDAVAKRISAVPGVHAAMPIIEGQALASGPRRAAPASGPRHPRPGPPRHAEDLRPVEDGGGLLDFDNSGGVAIGTGLSSSLGVNVGDKVTLLSPRGAITPMGTSPRVKSYPVVGDLRDRHVGIRFHLRLHAASEAQIYFNRPDEAQAIEIYLERPRPGRLDPGRRRGGGRAPGLQHRLAQRNVTFFSALEVERNVMFLILTLIVLVAALNIISGLIMLVKDKGHDIAILRTMGATQRPILRVFFITGASIGTVGTLAGLAVGTSSASTSSRCTEFISCMTQTEVFSPELYFLSSFPPRWTRRNDGDRVDGAGALLPRHALSGLAGGAARSGRGAALRMSESHPARPNREPAAATQLEARGPQDALAPEASRGLQDGCRPAHRAEGRQPRHRAARWWRWWRRPEPASRRSSTSPVCWSIPTAATSSSRGECVAPWR